MKGDTGSTGLTGAYACLRKVNNVAPLACMLQSHFEHQMCCDPAVCHHHVTFQTALQVDKA